MLRNQRWVLFVALLPLLIWSCLTLAYFRGLPAWLAFSLACCWGGAVLAGNWRSRFHRSWLIGTLAGILLIGAIHFVRSPLAARDWIAVQERSVRVHFDRDTARVENLRDAVYRADESMKSITWFADSFPIDEAVRVDFVHEILSQNGVIAHGFLTFTFSDDRRLAVSVEARRKKNEFYGPVRGLFRNYELIYVLGTEPDLIGVRAHVRKNPVYRYPIRATPEQVQKLLRSILIRADALGRQPEYYNTLTNNCVTNILLHLNELTDKPLRYDTRILFPGFADGLLHELALIDFDGTLEEARTRFRVGGTGQ